MSHPDEGVLQELLDGELAPADEAVVRAHLAACAVCAARLEDLRVTQAEAVSIVSRLDLDPPLGRAASRRPGVRRGNLRLLGLAASTVLVAGTSWMLLRTSAEPSGALHRVGDSAANATRSAPREERDQAPATAPAPAAPAASPLVPPAQATLPAAASERKALADAAPALSAEDSPGRQDNLKEEAKAPTPAAVSGALGATAASRASDAVVAQAMPATSLTLTDAEARLGWKVRTIEGLTPQSVELLPVSPETAPGLASGVRQRYQVGSVPVILVQQAAASDELLSVRGGRVDGTARQRPAEAEPAAPAAKKDRAPGVAPAKVVAESGLPMRVWRSGGMVFELSGALPADSLEALKQRVR